MHYIYVVTNPGRTTLYTGVTNNLQRRLSEHRANRGNPASFAGKYYCYKLLYYEQCPCVSNAIAREKEIKLMGREQKEQLIRQENPQMNFLCLW